MNAVTTVLAEAEVVQLPMEPWVFGLIALVIFLALAGVLLSYRDVANRHSGKVGVEEEHVTKVDEFGLPR